MYMDFNFDVISLVIGIVSGSLLSYFVKEMYLERKIRRLEMENSDLDEALYSYQQKERNTKGLQVKADMKQAEITMFSQIVEGLENMPQFKEVLDKTPQMKGVLTMAKANPEMVLKLIKKNVKL
jgi:hypothetical protein